MTVTVTKPDSARKWLDTAKVQITMASVTTLCNSSGITYRDRMNINNNPAISP